MNVIATCASEQASLPRCFACIRIWSVIVRRRVWRTVAENMRDRYWCNEATKTALSGAMLETFSNKGVKRRGRTHMR